MITAELIEILRKYPADMRVCVQGYEGGISDIRYVKPAQVVLNANREWYYGPHEVVDDGGETVLVLPRAPNPNAR